MFDFKKVFKVEYFEYDEELCVQMLHIGPYDSEPETVENACFYG